MDLMLKLLGITGKLRLFVFIVILALFPITMIFIALFQAVVESKLGYANLLPALITILLWVAWTIWHSYLFPIYRSSYLRNKENPYRSAFVFQIFPGVCIGFSQMLRPVFNGNVLFNTNPTMFKSSLSTTEGFFFIIGLLICLISTTIFGNAIYSIGICNAGFVPEFVNTNIFQPLETGVYKNVRHPLFWSGVMFSLGLATIVNLQASYIIAIINIIYGLIYNYLEDKRLINIFGHSYLNYAKKVPRCIPKIML